MNHYTINVIVSENQERKQTTYRKEFCDVIKTEENFNREIYMLMT